MSKLSPQAQAVMDTMYRSYDHEETRRALAAGVLRAAADQVLPDASPKDRASWSPVVAQIRRELLAIAAELEQAGEGVE